MKSRFSNALRFFSCRTLALILSVVCGAAVLHADAPKISDVPETLPITAKSPTDPSAIFHEFDSHWQAVLQAISKHDYRSLVEEGSKTASSARKIGLRSLDEYALRLVAEGNERLKVRDYDGAALFARKVLEFAPRSSRVLLASLPLVVETHTRTFMEQFGAALSAMAEEPDILLRIFVVLCYPLLWALTLAVYCIALITAVAAPRQLLHSLMRRTPGFMQPLAPVLLLALFIIPIFSGVLVALAVWGFLLVLLLPEQRWVGVWAGVVVTLWGALIPLHENIELFLSSPGGQAVVRALNGDYVTGDEVVLAEFSRLRPGDGVALYAHGVTLRRRGEYPQAAAVLEKADRILGVQPYALGERGVVEYQNRALDAALELHKKAEEAGLDSAQFYFNFSKLYFDKLDTQASRHYFELAQKTDSRVADELRRQEEHQGADAVLAVADIILPSRQLYLQSIEPLIEAQERSRVLIGTISPVETPVAAVFLGIALILGSVLCGRDHEGMYNPESRYSVLLRIIPGGGFVLRGHGAWGIIFAALALILIFPLLTWPSGSEKIYSVIQPGIPYYVGFLMLYLLLCPWIGDRQE